VFKGKSWETLPAKRPKKNSSRKKRSENVGWEKIFDKVDEPEKEES